MCKILTEAERQELRELLIGSVPTCDDVCYHSYLELLIDMRRLFTNPTPEDIAQIKESWKRDLKLEEC